MTSNKLPSNQFLPLARGAVELADVRRVDIPVFGGQVYEFVELYRDDSQASGLGGYEAVFRVNTGFDGQELRQSWIHGSKCFSIH